MDSPIKHTNIRDRLNAALQDYEEINLGSEYARQALIDRIIHIVQSEPVDSKYWQKSSRELKTETWTSADWVDYMKDYEEHGN
tara:strand:+ start:406 stop:654 length:249 start_codon:yes stop_codon:yes gene_type:complete